MDCDSEEYFLNSRVLREIEEWQKETNIPSQANK